MAAEASQNGWKTNIFLVEVGCRGFVATSTTSLLRKMGLQGHFLQRVIKSVASSAEKKPQLALDEAQRPKLGTKIETSMALI